MDEGEHGDVHKDTLDEEGGLVVLAEPEDDPQSVGQQECQTHVQGEALGVMVCQSVRV